MSLGSAFPISAGDTVAMSTHWYGGSNAHAVFYWHNYRTGTVITVRINDKSVAGDLSSNHDGTSAEVIDERGAFYNSSDKSWYYAKLRQHTTTHWTHAVSARGQFRQPGGALAAPHLVADHADGQSTGTLLEKWNNSPSASSDFDDHWHNCGSVVKDTYDTTAC